MNSILKYQQRCYAEYCSSMFLPVRYTYIDGNPIKPVVPVQTTQESLMIIGAYPSAKFEARYSLDSNRKRLVPIADNLQPFGIEEYFDGQQVRRLTSGDEIQKHLLDPLGINLEACWVTDLVKVFLYKTDHQRSCAAVKPGFKVNVMRNQFSELGTLSLDWIRQEVSLCRPKLIVTLGHEVAQVVSGRKSVSASTLLANEVQNPDSLDGIPTMFAPHPDACRRYEKWQMHLKVQIRTMKILLSKG